MVRNNPLQLWSEAVHLERGFAVNLSPMLTKPILLSVVVLAASAVNAVSQTAGNWSAAVPRVLRAPGAQISHFPSTELEPIFRNLAAMYSPYDTMQGIGFSGPDTPMNNEYWVAMPFTPATDSTVYAVQLAISTLGGTDRASVSLNADSGGVPGAVLQSWTAENLGLFQSQCCELPIFFAVPGVAVQAGLQYWVVAAPAQDAPSFNGAWYFAPNQGQGLTAYNLDETGWLPYVGPVGAFAVFGLPAN